MPGHGGQSVIMVRESINLVRPRGTGGPEGEIQQFSALDGRDGKEVVHWAAYEPMDKDRKVSLRYQLIMGNWGHAQGLDPGIYLQWFETWLKGVDTGIENTSTPIHFGPEYPSSLNLPQLPFNAFKGVRSGQLPTDWADGERTNRNNDFTLPLEW